MWTPRFAAALVAVCVAAPAGGCGAAPRVPADGTARIAFTAAEELYVIDLDGRQRVRLTRTGGADAGSSGPSWSPDGERIAFERRSGADSDIWIVGRDGTGERRVTAGPGEDDDPAFSPDGERIAFVRWDRQPDGPPRAAIFVVGPDGGEVTRLTSGPVIDSGPAWSPDGAEIAFTRVRFRGHQPRAAALHVMAADGTRVRRLAEGGEPAWSPDGRRLAFVSLRDRFGQTCFHDCIPSGEIYTVDPDGSGLGRLTRTRAHETGPAWSPHGGQIVFSSDRSDPARHDYELYVMSADGGCVTRLTNASSWSHEPAWQPGGGRAPCARDGIAPGARRPLVDTDLAPARAFTAHRLFYLGRTFRGLLLSYASGNAGADFTFAYDNCGRTRPAACPPSVQVQNRPLCDRPPAPERATLRRARERGAPVVIADHAGEEVTADVLTADAAVRVIADTHADVRRALAALRPLDESLGRRLPPPHRC